MTTTGELPGLSVVIPVFNEAESVPKLYEALAKVAGDLPGAWEFIFVDDGSRDGTWEALRETLGMRSVAVQPIAGRLEERGRALHLTFGVVRFDFLLERVVADLPLVEGFDEVLVEPRVEEAGFGEVLAEGGDDGAVLREGQALGQQQRLGDVEHGVIGSRDGKTKQPAFMQHAGRFDALAGALQDPGALVWHGTPAPLGNNHALSTDVHHQRRLPFTPIPLSNGDDTHDALMVQRKPRHKFGEGAHLLSGEGKVIEDQGHIQIRTRSLFGSGVRSIHGQPSEAGSIQLLKAVVQLSQDLLSARVDGGATRFHPFHSTMRAGVRQTCRPVAAVEDSDGAP